MQNRSVRWRLPWGGRAMFLCWFLVVVSAGSGRAAGAESFSAWLDGFRQAAAAAGISAATLDAALTGLEFRPEIVTFDRNQPETVKSLDEYLGQAINNSRVLEGQALLKKHRRLFGKLADRYKIPSRILVALWGIETSYGRHQGQYPVVQSLATLAYDGRRSDYFRQELIEALKIIDSGELSAENLRGSWAGAMGQLQFMPSTFRHYAIDQSADGRRDIFGNEADVLASAANYLAKMGWETDQNWGREVSLPIGFNRDLIGLEQQAKLSQWGKLGVRLVDGKRLPKAAMVASLVQPDGPGGRCFLVYGNYRVLRTWNKSHRFALAVGLLADRLVGK